MLYFWSRMTLSPEIGHLLVTYAIDKPHAALECMALAQKVFQDIGQHAEAVKCMIHQGRLNQALGYAVKVSSFKQCLSCVKVNSLQ